MLKSTKPEREPGNGKKGAISETNFRNNEKRCF